MGNRCVCAAAVLLAWILSCIAIAWINGSSARSHRGQSEDTISRVDSVLRHIWHHVGMFKMYAKSDVGNTYFDHNGQLRLVPSEDRILWLAPLPAKLQQRHRFLVDLIISVIPLVIALILYDYLLRKRKGIQCPMCSKRKIAATRGYCDCCKQELVIYKQSPGATAGVRLSCRRLPAVALASLFYCVCLYFLPWGEGIFVFPAFTQDAAAYSAVDLGIRNVWHWLGWYAGTSLGPSFSQDYVLVRPLPVWLAPIHQGLSGALRLAPVVFIYMVLYRWAAYPKVAFLSATKCRSCGYDLSSCRASVCPECGTERITRGEAETK